MLKYKYLKKGYYQMDKILIVGAGLSGATLARLFADADYKVTIIDRRETIGGNVYDYIDKNGILVQKYGPHIFHTEYKEVFDFLSRFTAWTPYEHKVLANFGGKFVPVPFNLNSVRKVLPDGRAEALEKLLIGEVGENNDMPISELQNHPDKSVRDFANYVYKNIFYKYTVKQWGMKPEELGGAVMDRVPVSVSFDDRYFKDEFQFMPTGGFTEMVSNMLKHKNITLKLGEDCRKNVKIENGRIFVSENPFEGKLIYTGAIDELFGYKYGRLPYRSLKFKFKTKNKASYQPAAVVNYTMNKRYTRITEFSKFTSPARQKTVILKEYPKPCKNKRIAYYPIPTSENYEHYKKYADEAAKVENLYLLGRLALYEYINMDVAVKNAFGLYERIMTED